MAVFISTLNQMVFMFLFMLLGYLLKNKNLLPDDAGSAISKLENLVFMPCLVLNTFIGRCTIRNLIDKLPFLLYGCASLAIAIALAAWLTHYFTRNKNQKGIYRYSLTVANIAFMGNAVVEGVFGEEILFDYLIFTLPINLFLNSIGISWLMPSSEDTPFWRKLLGPVNISSIIGVALGITAIPIPKALLTTISAGSACMAPMAMLLTGFIIGEYSLKFLLSLKKIYLVSIYRLALMPLLFAGLAWLFPIAPDVQHVLICAYSMPLGLNAIVIPAAYGGDTTLGAGMALISNVLALFTIPASFYFLIA